MAWPDDGMEGFLASPGPGAWNLRCVTLWERTSGTFHPSPFNRLAGEDRE